MNNRAANFSTRQLFETMARAPEEDLPQAAATALQTVGAKGYDGFAISIVEGPVAAGKPA